MNNTDKYYEIDKETAYGQQKRIMDALCTSAEKHNMTMEDINALGRILAYRIANSDDNSQYEHVVDFLWMSFHIETNHKALLLDLLEDEGHGTRKSES